MRAHGRKKNEKILTDKKKWKYYMTLDSGLRHLLKWREDVYLIVILRWQFLGDWLTDLP